MLTTEAGPDWEPEEFETLPELELPAAKFPLRA
jgi:hypothetical protein